MRTVGRRWKSRLSLFGLPLVHVAQGPSGDERRGVARGIIAVGDVAYGWLAVGGVAIGLIAVGGLSIGIVSLGGLALGLLLAGGLAIGAVAAGGVAIGGLAVGGGALGYVAQGGGAIGYFVRGGGALGTHVIAVNRADPEATRFFSEWSWLFGSTANQMGIFLAWFTCGALVFALLLGLLLALAYIMRRQEHGYP